MEVSVIKDKLYVSLNINEKRTDIELKEITNHNQADLFDCILRPIRTKILNLLNRNEIYQGAKTIIDWYWTKMTCVFKNEELDDLSSYIYKYFIKIDDEVYTLKFEIGDFATTKTVDDAFYREINKILTQSIVYPIEKEIERIKYTRLEATIQCACTGTMLDAWDNSNI